MLQVAKCLVVDGLLVAGRSVTWVIYARDTGGISRHRRRANVGYVPSSNYTRASALQLRKITAVGKCWAQIVVSFGPHF